MIQRLLLVLALGLVIIVLSQYAARLIILQMGETAPDTSEALPCLFSIEPCSR